MVTAKIEETFVNPVEISSHYDFGIVGRRWLAAWIDGALNFGILLLADFSLGNSLYQQTLGVWLALVFAYYPIFEVLLGRTPGKMIAGIVVVNEKGSYPTIVQSITRTVFRIVEINPILFGGLIAGIVVLSSKNRQRLGDMVARTYVLTDQDYEAWKGRCVMAQSK